MLPARAGMVPPRPGRSATPRCAPRASGDGPCPYPCAPAVDTCSPRERGWSVAGVIDTGIGTVLPARAGMVPPRRTWRLHRPSAPRASGDGPAGLSRFSTADECSPRERGWSLDLHLLVPVVFVLPARAGMVPATTPHNAGWSRAPRASGDGPDSPGLGWWAFRVLPARAGMVPSPRCVGTGSVRAPRASGDGPGYATSAISRSLCSPRERGWSHLFRHRHQPDTVLPARAGMVRRRPMALVTGTGAPRASGDGPPLHDSPGSPGLCSPRERGWSRVDGDGRVPGDVLPARAGMVPLTSIPLAVGACAPRASGDGPCGWSAKTSPVSCSPRERGWSRPLRPAGDLRVRAPRASGDGPPAHTVMVPLVPCSPRERGWSRRTETASHRHTVLPARAGMVPPRECPRSATQRAPRASGDGPSAAATMTGPNTCSPRERGWSTARVMSSKASNVLPARAGMVRSRSRSSTVRTGAPRASGDGPSEAAVTKASGACSPRERGWSSVPFTPPVEPEVLPARAGMVPRQRFRYRLARCAPRASGDGPDCHDDLPILPTCSPRERGWSGHRLGSQLPGPVLPARAGMVPPGTCPK